MKRDRRSPPGLAIGLVACVAAGIFAPRFAPLPPNPVIDPGATRDRPPGTTLTRIELAGGERIVVEQVRVVSPDRVTFVHAGVQRVVAAGSLAAPPSRLATYPLGTDHLGRDLLSRLLHGWRNSLTIVTFSAFLALLGGAAIGLVSAYAGGILDRTLMRLADIWMALPKLFLLLAFAAALEPTMTRLVVLLGAVSWMPIARQVRAEALTLRRNDFTEAAKSTGCSPARIVLRHQLPHLLPTVGTLAMLQLGSLILLESSLSFVGAGLPPPTPTLGSLVADAALRGATTWWMALFPGIAIVLPSLSCLWLADRARA